MVRGNHAASRVIARLRAGHFVRSVVTHAVERMMTSATERVRIIQAGQTYVGMQGFTYGAGASRETVGATHICMNVLPMPDGGRAKVHYHRGIETIAYLLEGECAV